MISQILFSLWFFLPAGFANMLPIFAARLPFLKDYSYPLDGYKKIHGIRILGDHKTVRGLLTGVIGGIIFAYVQQYIFIISPFFHSISLIDYAKINPGILGFLLGLGALLGDAVKSFLKRQLSIEEGKSWLFFDQIDYVMGGIVLSALYIRLPISIYGFIIFLWFLLHILVSFIGFLLRLKDSPI